MRVALDISEKLRYLCDEVGISSSAFIAEFSQKFSARPYLVEQWISGQGQPRQASLSKLTDYWSDRLRGFSQSLWYLEPHDFAASIGTALREETISIKVSRDSTLMTSRDIRNLVGTYYVYRHSFFNNGRVARDVLRITANHSQHGPVLQAELRSAVSHTRQSQYTGPLLKSSQAYCAMLTDLESEVGAVLMLSFPAFFSSSRDKSWGIISGNSSITHLPVAARFLSKKATPNNDDVQPLLFVEDTGGYLSAEDQQLICNNPDVAPASMSGHDYILTVSAEHPDL
jgi:hypothetical protein